MVSVETAICCFRSTPTAPALVVWTVSQPATVMAAAAMHAKSLEVFIVVMFRLVDCANNQPFAFKMLGRAGISCRLSPMNRLSTGGCLLKRGPPIDRLVNHVAKTSRNSYRRKLHPDAEFGAPIPQCE